MSDMIEDVLSQSSDQERFKEACSNLPLSQIVALQAEICRNLDEAKEIAARWSKLYDQVSITILPEKMEDSGIESLKVEGIGRVNLRADMWTKVCDKQALADLLRENGYESMIGETINASTLKAFIKEQNGRPDGLVIDEEIVSQSPYTRAVITKQ